MIDLNAEAAAVRAGYSPRYARGNAYKLVARSGIKEYIAKRMAEKESELIADQDEVLRYLTAVMREKSTAEEIVVEGTGDGCSEALDKGDSTTGETPPPPPEGYPDRPAPIYTHRKNNCCRWRKEVQKVARNGK